MAQRKVTWTLLVLIIAIVLNGTVTPAAALLETSDPVAEQVQALIPLSQEMVDRAIAVLSGGLSAMTPADQLLFEQLFDPGNTGDIDKQFIADVLANYKRIRGRLQAPLSVVYKPDSDRCEGKRLYYTDLVKIYVCPYLGVEDSVARKARVLIHEAVHMALLVVDRPYFHKNTYSTRYQALTPRGSWTTRLPLLGPLFREIAHGDTLYHPDAYAWFAVELSAAR